VYETTYYVNDLTRPNVEVLSAIDDIEERSYTYGLTRLSMDGTDGGENAYLYDARGTVVQVRENEDEWQYLRYGPYGEVEEPLDDFVPYFAYNGEEYSPDTGLQYLRARYYAPGLGRFITEDSFAGDILKGLSQNRYIYTENSPANYKDPSGLRVDNYGVRPKTANQILADLTRSIQAAGYTAAQTQALISHSTQAVAGAGAFNGITADLANRISDNAMRRVALFINSPDWYDYLGNLKIPPQPTPAPPLPNLPMQPTSQTTPEEVVLDFCSRLSERYTGKTIEDLVKYICVTFKYAAGDARELIQSVDAKYPTGNSATDKVTEQAVINIAGKHHYFPEKYNYLGKDITEARHVTEDIREQMYKDMLTELTLGFGLAPEEALLLIAKAKVLYPGILSTDPEWVLEKIRAVAWGKVYGKEFSLQDVKSHDVHRVPLIGQEDGMWCWNATARMLALSMAPSIATGISQTAAFQYVDEHGNLANDGGGHVSDVILTIGYYSNSTLAGRGAYVKISEGTLLNYLKASPVILLREKYNSVNDERESGHYILVVGYVIEKGTYYFLINDPLPVGSGSKYVKTYEQLRSEDNDDGTVQRLEAYTYVG
jgi:RHS repeat-associated protein